MESKTSQRPAGNASLTVMGKTTAQLASTVSRRSRTLKSWGLPSTPPTEGWWSSSGDKLYPSAYENRCDGQQVRVSGRVIKQQGRFTWIEPTDLMVQK